MKYYRPGQGSCSSGVCDIDPASTMRWVELVAWFALVLQGNFVIVNKKLVGRVSLTTGIVQLTVLTVVHSHWMNPSRDSALIGLLLYPGPGVDHSGCNIVSHQDGVTS